MQITAFQMEQIYTCILVKFIAFTESVYFVHTGWLKVMRQNDR